MVIRWLAPALAGVLMIPAAASAAEPKADPAPVERAQDRVAEAKADLREATAAAQRLRTDADTAAADAERAEQDLSTIAREAYRGGALDVIGIATLFDSPNPSDAMRRAAVVELLAEHQDSQVADALAAVGRVDILHQQADVLVSQARSQLRAAEAALKAVKGNRDLLGEVGRGSGGSGTALLTKRCLNADIVVDVCAEPPWSEQNLTFDAVLIERFVHVNWPQVKDVGGWRPSDPYPDHPSGRAVDIMMPNGGAGKADVALGDEIAEYFQENAAEYGIYYMIWRQRMWKASDPVGQWTGMSDRGSPTANHMDHVHISVTNGSSGTGFELAELRSQDLQKLLSATRDRKG